MVLSPARHLFRVGLIDCAGCGKCKQAIETASHAPCDRNEFATLRIKYLGQHFLNPGDFEDIPINKILPFIQNMGLCECVRKGAAQKMENNWSLQVTTMPAIMHSILNLYISFKHHHANAKYQNYRPIDLENLHCLCLRPRCTQKGPPLQLQLNLLTRKRHGSLASRRGVTEDSSLQRCHAVSNGKE